MNPTRSTQITAYREIRIALSYDISGLTAARFNAACLKAIGQGEATPAAYLAAAEHISFKCTRCSGTGEFITGMHNGRPTGPGGVCFRCEGKGAQTLKDAKRNAYHDAHYCPPLY